jgi:hypothetical protein
MNAVDDWHPGEDLTELEQEVCHGSDRGMRLDVGPGPYDLAAMQAWEDDRTVRASVLRHLLVGSEWPVRENGVQLRGLRISGHLDLGNANIRCPLLLDSCYLSEQISLTGATASLLVMKDCLIAGLSGDMLVVSRALDFSGSTFASPVRLTLADIRGGLYFRGCHLRNPDSNGTVLFAERIKVGADFCLDMYPGQVRFVADGALSMSGATIAGNLSCIGAHLTSFDQNGTSLMAQQIKVGDGVFLNSHPGEIGFTAQGTVNLVSAAIGGAVDCSSASLGGGSQDALTAAGMTVGSGVLLCNGFSAAGAIDLRGAHISANLVCRDGTELNGVNKDGDALHATSMKIGGYILFNEGFKTSGAIRLTDTEVTGDVEVLGARLGDANIVDNSFHSLVASGLKVGGGVIFGDGLIAAGAIDLQGADISCNLVYRGDARLNGVNEDGNSLNAAGVTVGGHMFIRQGFISKGAIHLVDAHIIGNLECRGVRLHGINNAGISLYAERIKVDNQIFLDQGFSAEGTIHLLGAEISGNLECRGAHVRNHVGGHAIYAERMKVGGDVYLDTTTEKSHFTAEGTIYLLKASIGGLLSFRGAQLKASDRAGNALFAERISVGGNVYLSEGFSASGNVLLKAATIGGLLEIAPYRLEEDKRRSALDATDLRVSGRLRWVPERQVQGRVSFEGATVGLLEDSWAEPGGDLRENGYWPSGGRLRLDGFTYSGFSGENQIGVSQRLQWIRSQIKPRLPDLWGEISSPDIPDKLRERGFTAQPYKQLMQSYLQVGKDTEARKIAIAQRRDRREYGHITWYRKIFDWLLDFFIGYGYQTWRAGAALLVLFGIVFILLRIAQVNNAFEPVQNATLLRPAPSATICESGYPCFDPFGYTIDTVIPLIDVHQVDYWGPNAKSSWGKASVWIIYSGTALGWFFATLALTGATGIVRRIDSS